MATKAELRSQIQGHLNRSDNTDTLTDYFLDEAIRRCQRELRIPAMDRLWETTAGSGGLSSIAIPNDFLELRDITIGDSTGRLRSMEKLSHRQLLDKKALAQSARDPSWYARVGINWEIWPTANEGREVKVWYFGEFSEFTDDNDDNELSLIAPDLLVWGALSVAGDYFRHDHTKQWEARFIEVRERLNEQARQQEHAGGPMEVQPAYSIAEQDWPYG